MNNKFLNIAFAAVLFLCAYYVFDWYDWTQLGVSTVLFLSGVNSLSAAIRNRRCAEILPVPVFEWQPLSPYF